MSDRSKIEWTNATWSPTLGCTRVSEGCDHCYAMRTVHRMAFNPHEKVAAAAEGLTAYRPGVGVVWTNLVRTLPDRLDLPLRWRKPRRVFVDSQSDLFHDQVPDEFIARVFAVMAAAPEHTFQILTKRAGRMRSLLSRGTLGTEGFPDMVEEAMAEFTHAGLDVWPLPNVWLGVSVENQKWANVRIPLLYDTPAAVRFLSCEPLLGPVEIGIGDPHRNHASEHVGAYHLVCLDCSTEDNDVEWFRRDPGAGDFLHWVIAGGESGAGARPVDLDWVRALRDECQQAKVPFLFKQVGGRTSKAGGRELDGRTWDEYPAVTS